MKCKYCDSVMLYTEGCWVCENCGSTAGFGSVDTRGNAVLLFYKKHYAIKKGNDRPLFLKAARKATEKRVDFYPNTCKEVLAWIKDEFYNLGREQ